MNKSAALERLTKLESEAAELRKIIEQPEEVGLWEPEKLQAQYSVWGDGSTDEVRGDNSVLQRNLIAHGNCFQTESIARKASHLQRVHNHVMRACFQADPDAGEWSGGRKWVIYLHNGRWIRAHFSESTDRICVHTVEQATEACRLLNAWQAKEDAK
jgi:hypothetical protein